MPHDALLEQSILLITITYDTAHVGAVNTSRDDDVLLDGSNKGYDALSRDFLR